MDINFFYEKFAEIYGDADKRPRLFFAPGRVNLIGEHTDYNGGYVFPASLNFGTYMLIRETDKTLISFNSVNMKFSADVGLDKLKETHDGEWIDYPLGVIDQLIQKGLVARGAEILFSGNIPNGAGLSSSASIEVVTALALNSLWKGNISLVEIAKLSQKAENEFVGVNCGIMDQFAVAMGEKDSATFLNCDTLEYKQVKLQLKDHKLVISNTNKKRKLSDSKYNERRSECETALSDLQKVRKLPNLSALTTDEFEEIKSLISMPAARKRAEHVIYENSRVLKAVEAIQSGEISKFGKLMNESHDSLRDLYEVTGSELDTLVEEARKLEGLAGSRMTGAGFGGCTVSIVRENMLDNFIEQLEKNYKAKTGLEASFYVPELGAVPSEIK